MENYYAKNDDLTEEQEKILDEIYGKPTQEEEYEYFLATYPEFDDEKLLRKDL